VSTLRAHRRGLLRLAGPASGGRPHFVLAQFWYGPGAGLTKAVGGQLGGGNDVWRAALACLDAVSLCWAGTNAHVVGVHEDIHI
jgi:hypothetical protein